MGPHLVLFITKLIEEEAIPPILAPDNGKPRSGIAVMGWSQGEMTAIAPFANPGTVDDATYLVLEKLRPSGQRSWLINTLEYQFPEALFPARRPQSERLS
ncbi:hypothetical protein PM082_015417 [Marasmius tenuissimus]|nr:hypothetical protein PM082_015417 [Marasmius tenuissimus]